MILTDEQEVEVSVAPVTAAGNPAAVDGAVIWVTSDAGIATVISTGPTTAVVRSAGALGSAQIVANADADLGAGIRSIMATLDIQVVAAEAMSVNILAGAPRVKT